MDAIKIELMRFEEWLMETGKLMKNDLSRMLVLYDEFTHREPEPKPEPKPESKPDPGHMPQYHKPRFK